MTGPQRGGALLNLLRERMIELAASDPGMPVADCAVEAVAQLDSLLPADALTALVASLLSEASGLGPLEQLLLDGEVDEVMVNGPGKVWVERAGRLELTTARFESAESLRDSVDRILAPSGRRADDAMPMADARLPDGSRVNVALPPLAIGGPVVTIRRFSGSGLCLADLERLGTLAPRLADMLAAAVEDGLNILVSGSTGSGKTTTLAALAARIPGSERVVTVEDAAELRIDHPHLVRLEARPPSPSGNARVTIRDLVRNSLRMRPDRIVVGEVRGEEAADMLDAMATGHAGSLSTIHAGSPRGAIARLAVLVQRAGLGLPHEHVLDAVHDAIDLVVQQRRLPDGRRVIASVAVVGGVGQRRSVDEIFRLEGLASRWRVAGDRSVRHRLRFR